jgi:hypothetical protein
MNKTEQIFFVSLDGAYESTTAVSAKTAIKAANTIHKRDGATNLVLRCGSVELKYRTTRGNKNLRGILGLMQAHNELGRNFEALQGELNTLAGWNDEQGERVDFMGLGFLAGMPSIAEKLGDDPPVTNMDSIQQIQQSWYADGWTDGAAALLEAAQWAEAGMVGEFNNGERDLGELLGAAYVRGVLAERFRRDVGNE